MTWLELLVALVIAGALIMAAGILTGCEPYKRIEYKVNDKWIVCSELNYEGACPITLSCKDGNIYYCMQNLETREEQ